MSDRMRDKVSSRQSPAEEASAFAAFLAAGVGLVAGFAAAFAAGFGLAAAFEELWAFVATLDELLLFDVDLAAAMAGTLANRGRYVNT
jgi:hypothetical protein